MAEAGILGEDERVELIRGEIPDESDRSAPIYKLMRVRILKIKTNSHKRIVNSINTNDRKFNRRRGLRNAYNGE
jgi:hypothetical protein